MRSALYEGWVGHRRFASAKHSFRHRLFMWFLDLSELSEVFNSHSLVSDKRFAPLRFRRDDHLGKPEEPLDESVRNLVQAECGFRPDGPICLLTNLRHFGYVMNPVSFYYCYGKNEITLDAFVAEVHNTPWNEEHCYVFDLRSSANDNSDLPTEIEFSNLKTFHVSPFMDMASVYRWKITPPGDHLAVDIECYRDEELIFDTCLELHRKIIGSQSVGSVLLRYPLMTAKVITAIHWHAFRLWLKGVPYVPHPQNRIHTGSQMKDTKSE